MRLPANSEGFKQLLTQLADAELNILDEELRRLDGEVGPSPELMPLLDLNDTWEAALKLWEADAAPQPKTVSEVKTQVARFKTVVGALPLSSLTSAHVAQFKTALLEKEALSKSRINTIVSLLSPVINVAMHEKFTPLAANPFSGAKFKKKAVLKDTEVGRDAFTIDELNQLYASPVFRQNARLGKGAGEAAYWLPLLGPHTGARLEDLCRLHASDVVQRDGVWCLHLHDTKREHRTGLANVMRHVPIHTTLLSLGWLDYVGTQGKHTLLFPRLKPNQYGQLSATWSTWFNEYLDMSVGLDDPRLVYHSFRHTFKTFGQLSGINDFAIEALTGHAPDSQYGRTEQGEKRLPFELLVQAMENLSFPGLSLDHLQAHEHTL